jgi:hypothetical protein
MKVGEYERLASALRQAGRADAAAEAYASSLAQVVVCYGEGSAAHREGARRARDGELSSVFQSAQ